MRRKINLMRVLGWGSMGLVISLVLVATNPAIEESTVAMDNTTVYAETRVAVKAAASLAVSVGDQVDIAITPKANGVFGYNSTKLGVSTNNEEGYKIFLMTGDGENVLKNTDSNKNGKNYEIGSIETETVGEDFMGNTWGYVLSADEVSEKSTYAPVPKENTPVYVTQEASIGGEDVYNLGFGTHISTDLAAGEYSNSVIISVVANPIKITNLSQLVYMQDMQTEFCDNAEIGTTKQLYDVRDGKRYWVAKLADGNCWMTQNLALDLVAGKTLTSADTDVVNDWKVPTSTATTIPAKTSANYTSALSWDLGKIILTNPVPSTTCSNITKGGDLTSCEWFKNVDGLTDGYVATETSSISEDGGSYDAHYLIGNYYQWNTATAGTGSATDTANKSNSAAQTNPAKLVDATSSICPKGWKLPTNGRNMTSTAGWPFDREDSFYRLFRAYGYPETGSSTTNANLADTRWITNSGSSYTATVGGDKAKMTVAPVYFVYSGGIYTTSGSLNLAAGYSNYWDSTAYPSSTSDAYFLSLDASYAAVTHNIGRNHGFPVRCLAR